MSASALSRSAFLRTGLCLLVLLIGCADQRPKDVEREVSIYRAAIHWLLDGPRGSDDKAISTTVYVQAVAHDISLDVQSGVVERLADFAAIRFIDEVEEAMDTGRPGDPVRGGGVLLGLGMITAPTDEQAQLYVERYRDIGQVVAYELILERSDDHWGVVAVPDQVPVRTRR